MSPSISNKLLKKSGILIRTFEGAITSDFLLMTWETDIENGIVTSSLEGVITDLSNTNFIFGMKDLKFLQAFYRREIDLFSSFKMAQVIDSPTIAYAKILEKNNPDLKSRAFSTVRAAIDWIMQ